MSEKKSFWTTLPGILTGVAGIITATGGLLIVLYQIGEIGPKQNITPDKREREKPTMEEKTGKIEPKPESEPKPELKDEKQLTFGNMFSNLGIVDYPNKIKVTINYTFLSKHSDIAKAAARPLKDGEYPSNYFSHSTEIIERGRGKLKFFINFYPDNTVSTLSTDQLEFLMWNDKDGTFFRVPFEHKKTWSSP